jgi:hypothetical protein
MNWERAFDPGVFGRFNLAALPRRSHTSKFLFVCESLNMSVIHQLEKFEPWPRHLLVVLYLRMESRMNNMIELVEIEVET